MKTLSFGVARYVGALLSVAVLVALFLQPEPAAAATDDPAGRAAVTVMTRNVYLGGNLAVLAAASTPQAFIDGATALFASVQATDFNQRAEALADEIAATQPDLIGLQEVALWRSAYPSGGLSPPNATHVEYDFLAILLDALAARGFAYAPVAVLAETDIQVPAGVNGNRCEIPAGFFLGHCRDIRFSDREVILAKVARGAAAVSVTNAQSATFLTNFMLPLPSGLGVYNERRGWVAVDGEVRGHRFRLVSAHLHADVPFIQMAQAHEIVDGPAATPMPLIFVCDCNSPADGSGTATYAYLRSNLRDAWTEKRPGDAGYTCCQAPNLFNEPSLLDERLDLVWLRGPLGAVEMRVVGDMEHERTDSGLWPSDHAGVAARLLLGLGL